MNKFVRNLLTEWRKLGLPFSDETFVVAVSGGADSVSLSLALSELRKRKKINLNFVIAHFNHDLRGVESDKDAEYVKGLAEKLNFEYAQNHKNEGFQIKNQKGNLEQNARRARYGFLNDIAEKSNAYAVLTAHTKNDQAETLLINLVRGSGLDGLGGISPLQKQIRQNEFLLVRPLLNWASRSDTVAFCRENNTEFRHDAMNDDLNFTRVRVRQKIIPVMAELNPNIIETLSQTAGLLRRSAEGLRIDEHELPEILSQAELKKLPKSMLTQVLRSWLNKHRGNLRQLDLKNFEAIERLIFSAKSGRFVQLPNGELVIKNRGKLIFEKTTVEKSSPDN